MHSTLILFCWRASCPLIIIIITPLINSTTIMLSSSSWSKIKNTHHGVFLQLCLHPHSGRPHSCRQFATRSTTGIVGWHCRASVGRGRPTIIMQTFNLINTRFNRTNWCYCFGHQAFLKPVCVPIHPSSLSSAYDAVRVCLSKLPSAFIVIHVWHCQLTLARSLYFRPRCHRPTPNIATSRSAP